MTTPLSLLERFKAFAKALDSAECIDELQLTREQTTSKHADYFLDGRKTICELKSLQKDTSARVEKILGPHRKSPNFPIFEGKMPLEEVLCHLPEGKDIHTAIHSAITDSVEGAVKKANRQIRSTKQTFDLPHAGGLLVILNDAVAILSPDVIAYRIAQSLLKRTVSDEPRFPQITVVWVLNEAHFVQADEGKRGIVDLIIPSGAPDHNNVTGLVDLLTSKWAGFNAKPLAKANQEIFGQLSFQKRQK